MNIYVNIRLAPNNSFDYQKPLGLEIKCDPCLSQEELVMEGNIEDMEINDFIDVGDSLEESYERDVINNMNVDECIKSYKKTKEKVPDILKVDYDKNYLLLLQEIMKKTQDPLKHNKILEFSLTIESTLEIQSEGPYRRGTHREGTSRGGFEPAYY